MTPDYIDPAVGIPLSAALVVLWLILELRDKKGR